MIQNIIAADFFLILAFLAWFLAGVISSSVFKNDAIQLAFNGIFQPVVQPALGILMIGSLAGGGEIGRRAKDGRLERSDSKRIIPFLHTNNFSLGALLLTTAQCLVRIRPRTTTIINIRSSQYAVIKRTQ